MGVLMGLPGVSAESIEAVFINKASDIRAILRSGKGATDAGRSGAINVWRDDSGQIRCEAQRHFVTVDSKAPKTLKEAEKWVSKWKKEIRK